MSHPETMETVNRPNDVLNDLPIDGNDDSELVQVLENAAENVVPGNAHCYCCYRWCYRF